MMNATIRILPVLAALVCGGNAVAATTVDLGTIASDKAFASDANIVGSFSNTWTFNLTSVSEVAISVTNSSVAINNFQFGKISDFFGTLDGVALQASTIPPVVNGNATYTFSLLSGTFSGLTAGQHSLVIGGTGIAPGGSYGGSITVATVPVPAAIVLLGSALTGLVTIGRRRA
jgi:hypothetical protein